ncbi:uncharacterized protein ACB058_015286 [Synchiropus picturatus]
MDPKVLLLFSALVLGSALAFSIGVPTAQCRVIWAFGIPCDEVYIRVVSQIKEWQVAASCGYTGENCSYELVSAGENLIRATHTSPTTMSVNNLQFSFRQTTVCKVLGDSSCEVSMDPADNTTNYCSLQNVMDGSDLISAMGYKQYSNKWMCVGFDLANCTMS